MNKKYLLIFLILKLMLLPFSIFSEEAWEGSATRIRRGELENDGMYAASNSFPVNTVINVTNIKNGKSIDVTVIQRIGDNQNLFLLLTDEAADELEIGVNESENVRITIVRDYGSDISSNHDDAYNPDPDKNPQADLAMINPDYDSSSSEPDNIVIVETDNITEPDNVTEPDNITDPDTVVIVQTDITDTLEERDPQKDLYRTPIEGESFVDLEDVEPYDTVVIDKEPIDTKDPDTITEHDDKESDAKDPDETPEVFNGHDLTTDEDTTITYLAEPDYDEEDPAADTQEVSMVVNRPDEDTEEVESKEPIPPEQIVEDTTGPDVFVALDDPDESVLVTDTAEPDYPLDSVNGHIDPPDGITEETKDVAMLEPINPDEDTGTLVLVPTDSKPPENMDTEPDIQETDVVENVTEPDKVVEPDNVIVNLNIDEAFGRIYYIQLAAFSDFSSAQTLKGKYSNDYPVEIFSLDTNNLHKVVIGPLNKDEGGTLLYRFRALGYEDAFLRETF